MMIYFSFTEKDMISETWKTDVKGNVATDTSRANLLYI